MMVKTVGHPMDSNGHIITWLRMVWVLNAIQNMNKNARIRIVIIYLIYKWSRTGVAKPLPRGKKCPQKHSEIYVC